MKRFVTLVLVASFNGLPCAADPWFVYSNADKNLISAHQQFAGAHYEEMLLSLKHVLGNNPDEITQRNAFELLDAAFAKRQEAGIKLDWKLPPEITSLEIIQRRLEWADGTVKFQIRVAGNGTYHRLNQVVLIKSPGEILIDKAANRGRGSEYDSFRKDVEYRFNYHSEEIGTSVPDGLFFLKIGYDGGKALEGWFILSHLTPSSSPHVIAPKKGTEVVSGNPTFYWLDFQSERYQSFENRAVILRLSPKGGQLTRWFLKQSIPKTKLSSAPIEAKVGRDGILTGGPSLDPGLYWLSVAYDEFRRMGDLVLGAQGMTIVPMVIRKP